MDWIVAPPNDLSRPEATAEMKCALRQLSWATWWTITGNFGNILPIDWSKSYARKLQLPALNLNEQMDLDLHALILSSLQQEPIFTAEQVLEEIDEIMQENGPSEGGPSPDGSPEKTASDAMTKTAISSLVYGERLRTLSTAELNEVLVELERLIRQHSETLIQELALRDELEFEKELKNTFISLLLSVQNKRRHFHIDRRGTKGAAHHRLSSHGATPEPKYLTTVIPYNVDKGSPSNASLQILIKILHAINDDSPTVPTLLTDYILKAAGPRVVGVTTAVMAATPRKEEPAIGIDLGTTYSCVGIFQHGKVEIIANDQGNRTTPSYVAFTDNERLIGDAAKAQVALNPENTVFGSKRLIGRTYDDPKIQEDMKHLPFTIVNVNNVPKIKVVFKGEEKIYNAEEISAMILTKMREVAEAYLGRKVTLACVTVPAYFNDSQRQATKDAATIAGLSVPKILNEPTAAALAYGLDKFVAGEKKVLIVDLGGGTFDVSLLNIKDSKTFDVLATAGDTHLGGEDFDSRLVDYFIQEIKRKFKVDITNKARAVRRLRTAAERAKRILSSTAETSIEIDALFEGNDFYTKITRARFEELCLDLSRAPWRRSRGRLQDAKVDKTKIDEVVLLVKEFFNEKEPCHNINPDEAIAYGAAVSAALTAGVQDEKIKNVKLLDVNPLSLGIETAGGVMSKIIARNTKVPCKTSKMFTTYSDYQTAVTIQINVTFEIDENGILSVSAKDESTGKGQSIVITHEKGLLSQGEIDRMLKEAEMFRLEDIAQRERVAAMNSLQNYIFSVQQSIKEVVSSKIAPDEKTKVANACRQANTWVEEHQHAAAVDVQAKLRELQDVCSPLMVKMHMG
ncbi:hypothetical protein HPB48_014601 [Haemaphysalis longicornis]|uniref:Heat shock protein 70 n=1 Tax=Haemaphysalis longicornis TaxID=44386 RepID=A0A9J6H1S9_HAELO|nr:hypothetical protein HPB48_014601 [Haemaphysalis longicornis]